MTPRRMFPISFSGNKLERDEFGWVLKAQQPFTADGVDSLTFRCPNNAKGMCLVAVTLGPAKDDPTDRRWHWDGNMQAPSLQPSIDCSGHPRRCGWHGVVTNGCWQPDFSPGTP